MRNIAIIPARGGSKRIPKKNIRNFCGKPIIAYSIEAAQQTGLFETIVVSTDDQAIAEIAESLGASVPFLRSKENANDHATIGQVMDEVLLKFSEEFFTPDFFCCIFPTAPLLSRHRIEEGYQKLIRDELDSIVSIQEYAFPIQRSLKITELNFVEMMWPENHQERSQDLISAYHDAGQFYWGRLPEYLSEKRFIAGKAGWILLNWNEAHDIDTMDDWKIAEMKFRMING